MTHSYATYYQSKTIFIIYFTYYISKFVLLVTAKPLLASSPEKKLLVQICYPCASKKKSFEIIKYIM